MGTPPGPDGGHYFSEAPAVASRPSTVRLRARGVECDLTTDRGTFSPDRIDAGTAFLLGGAPEPPPSGRFLDLGCGYGPLAVVLATMRPDAEVVAVDVNARSRSLTAENATRLGLSNLTVAAPDEVGPEPFDLVWSNPPIRVGKDALHALLQTWLMRLTAGGEAILVVNRHLGADSLQRWLIAHDLPTERLASKKGYRLLRVTRF